MRILPPPWEGTHPAFPKTPEVFRETNPLFTWFPLASAGGVLSSTIFRIFSTSAYAHTAAITGILASVAVGTYGVIKSMEAIVENQEVYPLLEAEGVEIPKRRFFERTTNWTEDDSNLLGAGIGIGTFALMRRPLPGAGSKILRILGAGCFGASAGEAVHTYFQTSPTYSDIETWMLQQAVAKRMYESKTGHDAPRWLYPMLSKRQELAKEAGIDGHESEAGWAHEAPDREPSGPHPDLASFLRSDSPSQHPNRDYRWRSGNREDSLSDLDKDLASLHSRREELVEMAEFLWAEIAKRERRYKNLEDSETDRMLRKSLEWLSSCHCGTWLQISALDWMIADTKKIILQIQKSGDWLPQKPKNVDLTTYRPAEILGSLLNHRKFMANHLADLEKISSVSAADAKLHDDLKRSMQEVRENIMATDDLIREMEEKVRNPSSGAEVD